MSAIYAVLASLGAIMVYIWLRFEWQFSLGAVVALFHDVLLTIGIFSVLQIRFDLATIAALLTIVRLLDQRHGGDLRPGAGEPHQVQEAAADRGDETSR